MKKVSFRITFGTLVIAGAIFAIFSSPQKSFAASCTWKAAASGIWANAANWSCGAIPGAADDVIFSASSTQNSTWDATGPVQVKSVTVNATYGVGQLSLTRAVSSVAGSWTMNDTHFVQTGTAILQFAGAGVAATFTPGTVSYANLEDAQTGASTLTVLGTATVAGNIVFSGGSTASIASGTINLAGNVTASSTDFMSAASISAPFTTLNLNGAGTQNLSSNGGWLPSIIINKTTGLTAITSSILPVEGNWQYSRTATWSSGSSTLRMVGISPASSSFTTFMSSGQTLAPLWNFEDAKTGTSTLTLSDTADVQNNFILSGGPSSQITNGAGGETIDVFGDITITSTNFGSTSGAGAGNDAIFMKGTGSHVITSNGGWLPYFQLASNSETVTATGNMHISGAFTLTGGTFIYSPSVVSSTFEVDNLTSITTRGEFEDFGVISHTLLFGASVSNAGIIMLGDGHPCNSPTTVAIRSTVSGTQIPWFNGSQTGTYIMSNVDVKDQAGTAAITVHGTSSGNNGVNWTFVPTSAILLVQSIAANVAGATSIQATFPSLARSGDLVVVAISTVNQTITSVTDNKSNIYIPIASSTAAGSSIALFYAKGISTVGTSSASFIMTANGGGPANLMTMAAFEYFGVATSTALDASTKNSDPVGSASLTSGFVTGSASNELYFGAMTQTTSTSVSGSGWTSEQNITNPVLSTLYTEDQIATSSISPAATWTAVTSTPYAAVVAVFEPLSLAGYPPSGYVDSLTYDMGSASGAQLNTVMWRGIQPAGTSVGFQFAVSNSSSGPWTFVGPDGTSATFFTGNQNAVTGLVSTTQGYTLFSGYRYFRYRVTLFSDTGSHSLSPTVTKIVVGWSP